MTLTASVDWDLVFPLEDALDFIDTVLDCLPAWCENARRLSEARCLVDESATAMKAGHR